MTVSGLTEGQGGAAVRLCVVCTTEGCPSYIIHSGIGMLASCGEGDLSFRFLSQNCVFSRLVSWHVKFLHLIRNLRGHLLERTISRGRFQLSRTWSTDVSCGAVVVLNTTMTDETIVARSISLLGIIYFARRHLSVYWCKAGMVSCSRRLNSRIMFGPANNLE